MGNKSVQMCASLSLRAAKFNQHVAHDIDMCIGAFRKVINSGSHTFITDERRELSIYGDGQNANSKYCWRCRRTHTSWAVTLGNGVQVSESSSKKRILVVEDEDVLRTLIRKTLENSGYEVHGAEDGVIALEMFNAYHYDLILLDIMMPNLDGFSVCGEIRQESDIPIIILTALSRPDDIAHGLGLGADEYITKPFAFREMEVRIQSLLRRVAWTTDTVERPIISTSEITLNDESREVTIHEQTVKLTPTEYKLLRYLMTHADRPVSNQELLQNVWHYDATDSIAIIQSVVRRLRLKVEPDPSEPRYILSVWGVGYKFQT